MSRVITVMRASCRAARGVSITCHVIAASGRDADPGRQRDGIGPPAPEDDTMDATISTRPAAIRPAPLLRLALAADAAGSGATGLLALAGGAALAGPLGLPAGLLQAAGAFCLTYAALVAWMARRAELPAWSVWLVIGGNLVWTADSLLLLVSGWVAPTGLGIAFVTAQALAVAGFAAAQWVGLARSRG
jgi:hypothetical protein